MTGKDSADSVPAQQAQHTASAGPRSAALNEEQLDITSPQVVVRRHHARALARAADPRHRALLERLLSDSDLEVIAWAAFGLGRLCRGAETTTVARLAVRAVTLIVDRVDNVDEDPSGAARNAASSPRLQAAHALAWSLGTCGTPAAEHTLALWLEEPALTMAAASGLTEFAVQKGALQPATLRALLEHTAALPSPSALLTPLSQLPDLPESVQSIAQPRLIAGLSAAAATESRTAALAAARWGPAAIAPLEAIVLRDAANVDAATRALAARALQRIGGAAHASIKRGISELLSRGTHAAVAQQQTPALLALLGSNPKIDAPLAQALQRWLSTDPRAASAATLRRQHQIVCLAETVLVSSRYQPDLQQCAQPEPWSRQARLALLDQGPWDSTKQARWLTLAQESPPTVADGVLGLLEKRPELTQGPEVLASALRSNHEGSIATAASILARHPARFAGEGTRQPLESALTQATLRPFAPSDVGVQAALLDAIGALPVPSLAGWVAQCCKRDHHTLRVHAARAWTLLGQDPEGCPTLGPRLRLGGLPSRSDVVTLRFHFDSGVHDLNLDAGVAPEAVEAIVALVQRGFYTGTTIHRAVPGLMLQLGDPEGNGYGGSDDWIASELSPVSFEAGSVGLAEAGPDTGSSQLFVVLAPHPHLTGRHTWLGHAADDWAELVLGDRIERIEILEPAAAPPKTR